MRRSLRLGLDDDDVQLKVEIFALEKGGKIILI